MNTIKTLALATIIIGMASCASTQKSQMVGAFGKSTKLTTEEDSLFKTVVLSHSNLQLKPHKVSRQVVAGTNYRYECVDNNKKRLKLSSMSHLAKTEHSHPLGMVVSTHFRCGKGVKRGLKNGALPFNID